MAGDFFLGFIGEHRESPDFRLRTVITISLGGWHCAARTDCALGDPARTADNGRTAASVVTNLFLRRSCHHFGRSVVFLLMLSLLYEVDGYRARVERDRDGMLHGRVLDVDEVITFKAISTRFIERNFARALYAYFERCRNLGVEPEAPKPVY
jgi:hypothetical protein